jgi:beta-N-acetylhexosaminidase
MTNLDFGLRFIVEPSSTRLTEQERASLADLQPAGIMLRKRNFHQDLPYDAWLGAYAELLADVRQAIGRDDVFVSIDHEGGRVHRFPVPVTRFPYPAFYSASLPSVEAVARSMAIELRSLGINLSFAPVADIHSNPLNPVINQRSFGRTAQEVCQRAGLFARTLLEEGVLPCAKHFPGHGDTTIDSHHALPLASASLDELKGRELLPFAALVAEGIPMVMSAHLLVPALDHENPATLSRAILNDLLRKELGFGGVTVADALGMEGIRSDTTESTFVRRAQKASLDIFLFAGDAVSMDDALRCRDELRDLAQDQEESEMRELAKESQQRIEALLLRTPQYSVQRVDDAVLNQHAELARQLAAHNEWEEFQLELPGFE